MGTIQPRKNLLRLIEAFAQCRRERPYDGECPHLVIAGKPGWLTTDIERRVAELGLTPLVRFPGYVADADLPALLSAALAFVFPRCMKTLVCLSWKRWPAVPRF